MRWTALLLASLALASCGRDDQASPDAAVMESYRTAVPGWQKHGDAFPHHAIVNWLRLDASGGLFWNRGLVSQKDLAANLEAAVGFAPAPFLVLTIEEGVADENAQAVRQLADENYCLKVGRTSCGEGPSPSEWTF